LGTQGLGEFGEIVDDLLILFGALKGAVTLLKGVQRGLECLHGFRLLG